MKKFFILIAFSFAYLTILTYGQQLNYTKSYPDYSIDISKTGSSDPISVGGLLILPPNSR